MAIRRFFLTAAAVIGSGILGFQLGDRRRETPLVPSKDSISVERPLIGIASLNQETYIRAIRDHGGIPVILPNTDGSTGMIDDYLEELDGLIMPGGADIPPSEYGEEPHPTASLLSDERYQFEKALIHSWITKSKKPLLGICLGSQWINVASGGSLIQDIPSAIGGNHRNVNHNITLDPDSKLSGIFGSTAFEVNSSHHQAVKDLGEGLRVVAKSPDGVIEATETTDPDRFLIGVQWHPERLIETDTSQSKLFNAFIEAAREHASKK